MKQLTVKYQVRKGNFYALNYYLNQLNRYGEKMFNDKGKLLISTRELKYIILEHEEYRGLRPIDIQIFATEL
jgi:hypothetical protein